MTTNVLYEERLSSGRTTALFVVFTVLFLALFLWRLTAVGMRALTIVFLCLSCFFLFYSLNYRTLVIRLTSRAVRLRFGLFGWTIPLDSIEGCHQDEISLRRIGGAGIHFSSFARRYRAMFNFLEYPRLVVRLKKRRGLVRDIAFSTQQPDRVQQLITGAMAQSYES